MDGILAVKSKEEGQRAARRRMLSESGVRMARIGRVGNDESIGGLHDRRSLMTFTGTVGRKRQQLAALETTVEDTK